MSKSFVPAPDPWKGLYEEVDEAVNESATIKCWTRTATDEYHLVVELVRLPVLQKTYDALFGLMAGTDMALHDELDAAIGGSA